MVARGIDFTHHDSLVGVPVTVTRNRGMNNDDKEYHCIKSSWDGVQFL